MHVRRFLVDLLDKDESMLLTDIDGDNSLFVKMIKYGKALGSTRAEGRAKRLAELYGFTGPPGQDARDTPAGGGKAKEKNEPKEKKCENCLSFATKEARAAAAASASGTLQWSCSVIFGA